MLQVYRELQIVDSRRIKVVEYLSDYVKLDKVAAHRTPHESLPMQAAKYRYAAKYDTGRHRHQAHGARLAPSRHRAEPFPHKPSPHSASAHRHSTSDLHHPPGAK